MKDDTPEILFGNYKMPGFGEGTRTLTRRAMTYLRPINIEK